MTVIIATLARTQPTGIRQDIIGKDTWDEYQKTKGK
jgi:hypothetical protein